MDDEKYTQVLHDVGDMIVKKGKKKREASKLVVINEEELIRQVEKRPILYDKSLKGYRKSAQRDQLWQEIAAVLRSSVEECRKRWRSLRDAFSKHYKQVGDAINPKKKKWLFYDQMFFIAPYLECGSTITTETLSPRQDHSDDVIVEFDVSDRNIDGDENTIRENECESVQEEEQEEQTMDLNDDNQFMTRIFSSPADYEKENVKNFTSEQSPEYTAIVTTDPDDRFLLSCSPILKRLSNKKNALARLRIQELLYSIEFGNE